MLYSPHFRIRERHNVRLLTITAVNPTDTKPGNQHWGHATSQDLYNWINQPIAIYAPSDTVFVFSGSAVTDPNNTSGFFPDQDNGVVAIYTLADYTDGPGPQTQNIAYSRDGGYTFIPYAGNPVIDSTSSQFRDPKVIWYEEYWVMVVAFTQEFAIGIYTSPDLKDWTATSNFSYAGLIGVQYECPNMVEMPVENTGESMYLMYISINPGAPLGGSIGQYFPGMFNGTHFTAVDGVTRIADFGKDNYAEQFFYGTAEDEAPVSIAWASNWQYTSDVPTGDIEGWRGVMSLPRRNYLVSNAPRIGWAMVSEPYDLTPVIGAELTRNESLGNGSVVFDYSDVYSNAVYFEANLTDIPMESIRREDVPAYASINFTISSPVTGEEIRAGFFLRSQTFFLDRGGIEGFENPFFTEEVSVTTIIGDSGTWSLSGVVDRSIIEVFLDGGLQTATNTFYPRSPLTVMSLMAMDIPSEASVSVAAYALESVWEDQENEDGVVEGNTTAVSVPPVSKLVKKYIAKHRYD